MRGIVTRSVFRVPRFVFERFEEFERFVPCSALRVKCLKCKVQII